MRMSIEVDRRPVRGPACMADAAMAARRLRFQLGRQIIDTAGRLRDREVTSLVDRSDAAAIVAAIFEAAQPFDEKVDRLFRPDVSDDATHANPSCYLDEPAGKAGWSTRNCTIAGLFQPTPIRPNPL